MVTKVKDIHWGKPRNHDPDLAGIRRIGLHPDHEPDQTEELPSFLILGDSHAYALAHVIDAYLEEKHREERIEPNKYGLQTAYCGLKMAPGFKQALNGCTKGGRVERARNLIQSVLEVSPVETIFVAHRYHSIYHPGGSNWKKSDRLAFEFYSEQWIRRMSGSAQHIYLIQQIPECDYPFFANTCCRCLRRQLLFRLW